MAEVIPSPNIWHAPQVYEVENRGTDPDGVVPAAIRAVRDWAGADVLDVGCGTGFHLPMFAATARSTVGVEPHPPLVAAARRRTAALPGVRVLQGPAQRLPLPDASVDVAHARLAYFFGPGCEPGLAELERVLRRGGTAFVVDNDATRSTFGGWFRRFLPRYDPVAVERFWARHGWTRVPLDVRWEFATREEFEAVLRIEVDRELADRILTEHRGSSVDYAMNLFWRHF